MNYLALDTSGNHLTIILNVNAKQYQYFEQDCGVNHSVAVMQRLEELVNDANFDLKDIDFFAVVTGAGSFTGIRIGVSTIKALCFAYKKPCLAITSFDTLAYNKKSGKVLAVIDAKHDGFYVCGYTDGEVSIQPAYILKDQLKSLKNEYTLLASQPHELVDNVVSVVDGLKLAIADCYKQATLNLDSITPLYVRKSQAEEGR